MKITPRVIHRGKEDYTSQKQDHMPQKQFYTSRKQFLPISLRQIKKLLRPEIHTTDEKR
jgi:hypothetical protein